MPTRVLVLSGQRTLRILKEHTDFEVAFADEAMTIEQLMTADVPLEVDLDDWASVIAQAERLHAAQPFDAVVTGVERLVPLAGMLRDKLGLATGITEEAAHNCNDKAATHRLLAEAGVAVAVNRLVTTPALGVAAAEEIGLPVVVKPRDASSAAGLMYCETVAQVADAVTDILADGRDTALIEEFLVGPEIGVFASRVQGRTTVLFVVDGEVGPPPKFVKVGGVFPSRLPPERIAEIEQLTDKALAAVGLDDWVASLQFMLTSDGFRAGEINPRVSGGQGVELIAAVSGYEPSLVAVDAALGRQPQQSLSRAAVGLYRSIVFDEAGFLYYRTDALNGVPGLGSTHPPFIELDVRPGEAVLPINHARGGAFGRIVLVGDDADQLERDYRKIIDALALRVEPEVAAEASVERKHTSCC
ncbi:ATP-grasp domain-containing protein [Kutzneria sp. NPDC051319]|uniref:ATP-grasp domain-containing protein n=1 Tax=Kutzneria sp. NPDC051319 TaxID=3155047 RepID=UPI00342E0368